MPPNFGAFVFVFPGIIENLPDTFTEKFDQSNLMKVSYGVGFVCNVVSNTLIILT